MIVDTSVWSLFLRRRSGMLDPAERRMVCFLRELIADGRSVLPGIVRQELLSGIDDPAAFERLREHMRFFDDEPPSVADYERAAEFDNRCRVSGVAPSVFDLLICAIADTRGLPVLTTDHDFARYAITTGVRLHPLSRRGPS